MGRVLPIVVTLLLVAVVGIFAWVGFKAPPVATPAAIVTTPPGWVKLNGDGFSLYAPPGAEIRGAKGAGFTYGDIIGSHLCIRYQAGAKAGLMLTAKSHPDFTETKLEVDGHAGIVRRATLAPNEQQFWFPGCGQAFYAGLSVPGALPGGGTLVVEVSAPSDEALEDATMMFKSVRFAQ